MPIVALREKLAKMDFFKINIFDIFFWWQTLFVGEHKICGIFVLVFMTGKAVWPTQFYKRNYNPQ